jgi:hypothetical protein
VVQHSPRRLRWLTDAAVIGAYLAVACALFAGLGLFDPTRLPTCACGDVIDDTWFLALVQHQLAAGHVSLFTTSIDYPSGLNLLENASFPALGVLLAPVTALGGPVVALGVLVRAALWLSATAAYLVLRRLVRSRLAAAIGGAVYGFSPFAFHQDQTHPFLAFAPLPPVILWLAYRWAVSAGSGCEPGPAAGRARRRRARRAGAAVGALLVAQFFVDSEIAVATVVVGAIAGGVLWIPRWRRIRRPGVGVVPFTLGAVAVAVPLLAYPAWFALSGPQHLDGVFISRGPGTDLLSSVVPGNGDVLGALVEPWRAPSGILGASEYVGPLLLLAAVIVTVLERRQPLVRAAAAVGAVGLVLSFGPEVVIGSHTTSIPMPFALLRDLPVVGNLAAVRFGVFVFLAVGVLVAVAVDELLGVRRPLRAHAPVPGRSAGGIGRLQPPGRFGLGLLILGGVVMALPAQPFATQPVGSGAQFASTRLRDLFRPDEVVLAVPVAAFGDDLPMLWQAETRMRFRLIGGYGYHPVAAGEPTNAPTLPAPSAPLRYLLTECPTFALRARRVPVDQAADLLPLLVRRARIGAVVVGAGPRCSQRAAARLFAEVYGRPRRLGAFDVWTDLRRPAHRSDQDCDDRHVRRRRSEPVVRRRSGCRPPRAQLAGVASGCDPTPASSPASPPASSPGRWDPVASQRSCVPATRETTAGAARSGSATPSPARILRAIRS